MAAEADDSLYVEVQLGLAKADQEFEAMRRKWESTPVRISFETVNSQVAPSRTFGGVAVAGTPANVDRTPTATPNNRLAEQQQVAYLNRLSTMSAAEVGGYNGQPPLRPLPNASLNSRYGPMGYERMEGQYGSVQLLPGTQPDTARRRVDRPVLPERDGPPLVTPAPAARALLAGPIESVRPRVSGTGTADDPIRVSASRVAEDAFDGQRPIFDRTRTQDVPGGTRTTRTRGFFNQEVGRVGDGLSTLIGVTGAVALAQNSLGAINARELAFAQAGGDPMALARAGIDNDLATGLGRSIPLVGTLGGEIYEAYSGDRAAAERTLAQAGLREAVTASAGQRAALRRQAGGALAIGRAGLAGGESAQIASIGQSLANINDGVLRAEYLRENGAAERAQRDAAAATLAAARERLGTSATVLAPQTGGATALGPDGTPMFQASGLSYSRAPITFDDKQLASIPGATPTEESRLRINEYNAAVSAKKSADEALGKIEDEGGSADQYLASIRRGSNVQLESIRQRAGDDRRSLEIGTASSRRTIDLAQSGRTSDAAFEAQRGELRAELDRAREELLRLRSVDRTNIDDAGIRSPYTAEQNRAADDLIRRGEARISSLGEAGRTLALNDAADRARGRISRQGSLAAGRAALAFDPVGARLAENEAAYNAAIVVPGGGSAPVGSEQEARAREARELADAQVQQDRALTSQRLGYTLSGDARSLDYALSRNSIGQQAAALTGQAINEIQSLAQAGFGDEAERARANSLKRYDALAQDYGLSFRGRQFDAQTMMIDTVRDAQNPEEVFRSIADERGRVEAADASEGKVGDGKSGTAAVVTAIDELPTKFRQAIQSLIQN